MFTISKIKSPVKRRFAVVALVVPATLLLLVLWAYAVIAKGTKAFWDATVDNTRGAAKFFTYYVRVAWVGQEEWNKQKEDARKERIARLTRRRA